MLKGIDVSKHQGRIDWAKVKNEVDFVIIRAGYGKLTSQKDERFEEFYAGCKKYGIPVGCYWFSYATTEDEAIQEAKACLHCIKGKTFDFPVWFDLEHKSQQNSSICGHIIPAFIETIKAGGYYCGLYSYYSFFKSYIARSCYEGKYDVWLAHYTNNTPWTNKAIWQYSEKGRVNGINGNVDMDYCYKDYPSIIGKGALISNNDVQEIESVQIVEEGNYDITSSTNTYNQVHYPYGTVKQISKHFNTREFKCKCGGNHDIIINTRLVAGLEKLFETFNCSKIVVNSGYRCPSYDKRLNGFAGKHSVGDAADVVLYDKNMEVISTKKISCAAQDLPEYFGGIANINKTYTAIHLDVRQGSRWLGNEVISNSTVTKDFYSYYGLTKDGVYTATTPDPEPEVVTQPTVDPPMPEIKEEEPVVETPVVTEPAVEEPKLNAGPVAGDELKLKSTPLYSSANANRYSSKKTGTYYVYDGVVTNGRIRVTNKKENVERKPMKDFVTGWIDINNI